MLGTLRKSIVVVCAVLMVAGPLAGRASAHHEEDSAFEAVITLPVVGPVFGLLYYPEGEESFSGPWAGYLIGLLCHVPVVVECAELDPGEEPPPVANPPPVTLPPLPVPYPTPPRP